MTCDPCRIYGFLTNVVAYPLTPALSLGEREILYHAQDFRKTVDLIQRWISERLRAAQK